MGNLKNAIIAVLALVTASAYAIEKRFTYRFQGAAVGTNVFSLDANGVITSTTAYKIGPQEVKSTFTGKLENGAWSFWTLEESSGAASGKVEWKSGLVQVHSGGKQVLKDYKADPGKNVIFSANHPQLLIQALNRFQDAPTKELEIFNPNTLANLKSKATLKRSVVTFQSGTMPVDVLSIRLSGIEIQMAFGPERQVFGLNVPAQSFQVVLNGFERAFEDPLAKFPELSQPTVTDIETVSGVKMKTRDGVDLLMEIVRPKADGKYPTVLTRTPYGREASAAIGAFWASRGYVFVSQDVRGRGDSGGNWDPFNSEVKDGYDTLSWIAAQPWSNGSVGMIGASYGGLVQWSAAVTGHPALKCIIPQVSPPDPTRNIPWDHGAFMLAPALWWTNIVKDKKADMSLVSAGLSSQKTYLTLPISKSDDAMLKRNVSFFDEWLKRPTIEKWTGSFRMDQIAGVKIPVLHISGTWDGDAIGTKLHWDALRNAKHPFQWLIYGPWEHAFNTKTKFADEEYGPNAVIDLDSVYLRFFDTYLKGMKVDQMQKPRVRVFATGRNQWFTGTDWPLPYAKLQRAYLAGSRPNGRRSNGALSAVGDTDDEVATYVYDPNKPAFDASQAANSAAEASLTIKPESEHEGVLFYRGDPFMNPTIVTGPLKVELFVSTTAKDATFHAMLLDEAPNGTRRMFHQAGQMRVWFSLGKPQPIVPNKIYRVEIDPWDFAHEFKAGHRLTLAITSDRFPAFARNPGTGELEGTAKKLVRAKHSIYHGRSHPSQITYYAFEPQ